MIGAGRAAGRRRRALYQLALAVALAIVPLAARAERIVGYLYVEANEGSSSGGHVAMRFGDEVYHFQHEPPGVLRLHRDDAADFLFRYSLLLNRGVRESRVAVDDDTFDLLRDEMSRRSLVQAAQFDALRGLYADADLLAGIERAPSAPVAVVLPGFGFFDRDRPSGSAALLALRNCVCGRYGPAFLSRRAAAAERSLAELPPPLPAIEAPLGENCRPARPPAFSKRYADLLAARQAARLVEDAPALDPVAVRDLDGDDAPLAADERAALRRYQSRLNEDLCVLAAADRSDWGTGLAMGMARLAAVERSLDRGRWSVLDVHPAAAPTAVVPRGELRQQYLDVLAAESADDLAAARRDFASADRGDIGYALVESAANARLEAERGRAGGPIRLAAESLVPLREARLEGPPPRWSRDETAASRRATEAAADALSAELVRLHRYDLIRRNCVSELFATVDASFATLPAVQGSADRGAAIRAESTRRLGGWVETGFDPNFIPLASEAAVDAHWRVVERRTFPSYRDLRIAALANDEPAWRVALRESNTWTSATYRPGEDDSTFLFFGDAPLPLRPLVGAANVLYGLGSGVVGVAALPFGDVGPLDRGFRGALYSLPEIGFVHLRKGTTSFVERSRVPVPDLP